MFDPYVYNADSVILIITSQILPKPSNNAVRTCVNHEASRNLMKSNLYFALILLWLHISSVLSAFSSLLCIFDPEIQTSCQILM